MIIKAIKTRALVPPQDDLLDVISEVVTELSERSVLCISSKVVAIHQGRTVKIDPSREKEQKLELVDQYADFILPKNLIPHGLGTPTVTNNSMVASAGIDASNANGYFVLWPENPSEFAKDVRLKLMQKFNISSLGVIITDSHTQPLRYGTIGFAIGGHGIEALINYIGTEDLFGRKFEIQQLNTYEGLAATANVAIGEGNESTPLCLITELPERVVFSDTADFEAAKVPREEDIFYNLFKDYRKPQ